MLCKRNKSCCDTLLLGNLPSGSTNGPDNEIQNGLFSIVLCHSRWVFWTVERISGVFTKHVTSAIRTPYNSKRIFRSSMDVGISQARYLLSALYVEDEQMRNRAEFSLSLLRWIACTLFYLPRPLINPDLIATSSFRSYSNLSCCTALFFN